MSLTSRFINQKFGKKHFITVQSMYKIKNIVSSEIENTSTYKDVFFFIRLLILNT